MIKYKGLINIRKNYQHQLRQLEKHQRDLLKRLGKSEEKKNKINRKLSKIETILQSIK